MSESGDPQKNLMVSRTSLASVQPIMAPVTRLLVKQFDNAYYSIKERLGYHKRDIIVDRVEDARDSLETAKEQFQTALERFSELTGFEGGPLEECYRQLKAEFDYSQARAAAVQDRISAVEDVGEALFEEWREELEQYTNRSLKSSSRQQLKVTEQHYKRLIKAMHRAEGKINPVLAAFHDQVLFLKHNLNAQAIASLQNELIAVAVNITSLIRAMESSIKEANAFVGTLNTQKALPSA